MRPSHYIIMACDVYDASGEGNLAHQILRRLPGSVSYELYDDFIVRLFRSKRFTRDRVLPFYLILTAILKKSFGNQVLYLNYCPLWNPFVMILARLDVKLGPITGSYNILPHQKSTPKSLVRRLVLPILYRAGRWALPRHKSHWVATPSVKDFLEELDFNATFGRPFLLSSSIEKNRLHYEKNLVFVYTDDHPMKNSAVVDEFIRSSKLMRFIVVGKKIEHPLVVFSKKRVSRKDFQRLLSLCEYILVVSNEDAGATCFEAIELGLNLLATRETPISKSFNSIVKISIDEVKQLDPMIEKISQSDKKQNVRVNSILLKKYKKQAMASFNTWSKQL